MEYYSQPNITPQAPPGGGDAKPPYLQVRKPLPKPNAPRPGLLGGIFNKLQQKPQQFSGLFGNVFNKLTGRQTSTRPVVTPKSTAVPGEVAKKPAGTAPMPTQPAAQPAQSKPYTLKDFYNFQKGDLEAERNKALGETRAGAESRGLFYGSPLTGSEGDINSQFLRNLGTLQAGMMGNLMEDRRARLGMAANLGWQDQMNQPPLPGPVDFSALGAMFGQQQQPGNVKDARTGPAKITPKNQSNPRILDPNESEWGQY